MSAPRLTIISTRPAEACLKVLGVSEAPSWAKLVTEPDEVQAIPDGSRCIAIWFEPRKHRSLLEWIWIERRERGGISGLSWDEIDALKEWADRLRLAPALSVVTLRAEPADATVPEMRLPQ